MLQLVEIWLTAWKADRIDLVNNFCTNPLFLIDNMVFFLGLDYPHRWFVLRTFCGCIALPLYLLKI